MADAPNETGSNAQAERLDQEQVERLSRNMSELLQELRVVQSGVQILFAFLLTLPFTARFHTVTRPQRDAYLAALLLAGASVAFLIGPTSYHRIIFHHHDKRRIHFRLDLLRFLMDYCRLDNDQLLLLFYSQL